MGLEKVENLFAVVWSQLTDAFTASNELIRCGSKKSHLPQEIECNELCACCGHCS